MKSYIESGAVFSSDGRYRYDLWRMWSEGGKGNVNFVCLNPSTADNKIDDPTLRRCIGYAMAWGYDSMHMLNIFGLRSTNPNNLPDSDDPVGPDTDAYLKAMTGVIVVAWGNLGRLMDRSSTIRDSGIIKKAHCFGLTKIGEPRHPLYLPKNINLERW